MMDHSLESVTLLVIDDSESDRLTYSRYLQSDTEKTYQIIEAETLEEGLETWRSQPPDIVLIDLNLPDGDGLEFLEAINDHAGEKVPVIMLTGQGNEEMAVSAMKLGAADYLVKGDITARLLATTVSRVLRETALSRQLLRSQQQQILIAEIALRIREFMDLDDISTAIVKEVRQFIKADRAIVYQFNPDMSGTVIAEDIVSPWLSSLNEQVEDTCFRDNLGGAYCEGRIYVANDIYEANLATCHLQLLERFQVRANLVVPILLPNENKRILWGLLILHQCSAPRVWLEADIQLLQQLAVQIAISIKQAIAYQQVQSELAERQRVEVLLLNQQAELEDRNELLEKISEELECTVEELKDITDEQIEQYRVVQHEQERYQNLFDFAPDGYVVTDLAGKILEANQAIVKLLAIEHEFILSKPLAVFVEPSHKYIFYNQLEYQSSSNHVTTTSEITLINRQGGTFPAEITITKNINFTKQKPQLFWMIRDISDRKRNEQALQQLNQSLEAKVQERTQEIQLQAQMLEQIHDAVISTTLDGTILTWNFGAEKLYEYKSHEAIGQNISILYLNEDFSLIASKVINPLMKKETHEVELQHRTKSGKIIDIILRLSLVRDAMGNPIRSIGCSNDISDRKRAEQELHQLNQSLEGRVEGRTALLRESEVKSRAILATIPDLMIRVGADNVYREQITPHRETSIYSRGFDIIGRSINEIFPAENVQLKIHYLQQAIQTGELQIYEQQIQINDRLQYEEVRIIKCGEDEALLMIRDISDRKRAERALQKMNQFLEAKVRDRTQELWQVNQLLQTVLDAFPLAVFWKNRQSVFLGCNQLFAMTNGMDSPSDVLGKSTFDLSYTEAEILAYTSSDQQVMESGIAKLHIEELITLPSGEQQWLQTNKVPLRDSEGNVIGVVGTFQDISDRKQAELQLRKTTDRLALALNSGAIGCWEWDIQQNLLVWDDRMFELYGCLKETNSHLPYEIWANAVHPDDRNSAETLLQQAVLGQTEYDYEFRVIHPDRSIHFIKAYGKIKRDTQGNAQSMIGVNFDVSDRKQAEIQLQLANQELLRATKLKDEFLANMSHELRTPLNSILGFSESLKDEVLGSLNEKQLTAIATIESSGEHLLALINDILDLSKISSGMMELDIESVSVKNLCSSSLVFVKQQAFNKRIQIHSHIPTHINNINIDERRIKQVLINLLTNAVKFTPNAGNINLLVAIGSGDTWQGEATIPQQLRDKNSPTILFQVVDTGIGIAANDLQMLFQPFVQVDSALNRQYEGTGLGLALVKQIVELHGGQVMVESEVGQGSCFTVALPYEISPSNTMSNAIASMPSSTTSSSMEITSDNAPLTPLILLAEDNEANIQTFSSYLTAVNYRVIIARNGLEAIAQAKEHLPDIILMDIQMPTMDGLEATKQIRLDPNLVNIPIIALTALAMAGDREKCLAEGANEYLTKPVKLRDLFLNIQKLLSLGLTQNPNYPHPPAPSPRTGEGE